MSKSNRLKKATYKDIMTFGYSEGHARRLLTTIKACYKVKVLLFYHLYDYFGVSSLAS